MSIQNRVEDAEFFWRHGRKEGAWVSALIAAAATARKRYPKPIKDNESFKRFVREIIPTLLFGVSQLEPFPGVVKLKDTPLENIIYEHMRCNLVHEGELSPEVVITESVIVEGVARGTLGVGSPKEIPDFMVLHLLKAVREAPENKELFKPES